MIKKILFPILMVLMVVGGAVAADFLRSSKSSEAHAADGKKAKDSKGKKKEDKGKKDKHAKADSKGKKDKKDGKGKKDKGKKGKKGKDGKGKSAGIEAGSYLKFNRQFVVPVMEEGHIASLVIANLVIEFDENAPSNAYNLEPKFRDALTREFLRMSNKGLFGDEFTSAESYEQVRDTLYEAAVVVMPEGIRNVLILDIAKQDQ